jgi:hypothetical protein
MTKLVSLRVVIPTDDEVSTEEVQSELRRILEPLPVTRVGEDGARMHWSAVDVLRGQDRTAPTTPLRRVTRKAAAIQPAAE